MGYQGKKQGWKDFYNKAEYDKAHHDYYYRTFKIKVLKSTKYWYQNNKEAHRNGCLQRKFGISLTQYKELLKIQNYKCAICDNEETNKQYNKKVELSVDHCHKTKRIRGLLCGGCNTGLGKFKDNPSILRKAIDYLCH